MTVKTITIASGDVQTAALTALESWVNKSPMRYIMRDGEKVLQSPHLSSLGNVKWLDVGIEDEKDDR